MSHRDREWHILYAKEEAIREMNEARFLYKFRTGN
jgi:hypothetical protein